MLRNESFQKGPMLQSWSHTPQPLQGAESPGLEELRIFLVLSFRFRAEMGFLDMPRARSC